MNHKDIQKMKRICIIVTSPLIVNFFLRDHIQVLSKEFEVYLICNHNDDELLTLKELNLKRIFNIPIARDIHILQDIRALKLIYRCFKENKFDAIHSVSPKAGLLASIAGSVEKTKNRIHIFTGQVWASKKGIFRFLLKIFDKVIVKLTTIILVDGNSQREFLIKEKVLTTTNSIVLGKGSISGVDINRYKPNSQLRAELRLKLDIPNSTVVYLFMGRIKKDKGMLELFEAYKRISREKKNVYLLIVGYDEDNLIYNINQYLDPSDRFCYLGSTRYPETILPAADVFCLPSYREGFGSSIIEASSCSIPVICSDVYGLSDAFVDGVTGLKCVVKDVNSLFDKMLELYEDKDLRQTLGSNGNMYVRENFSSEIISNEWLKFYRNLFLFSQN